MIPCSAKATMPRQRNLFVSIYGSARNEVREVKLICWQGFTKSGQLGLMR
jgi:hypothetical protein